MQTSIIENKVSRAKFNLFRDKEFDRFSTYRVGQLRIGHIATIALSLSGTVSVSEDDIWVIENSTGELSFLDDNDNEIATIDLLNIEIQRDWIDRVGNIFSIDLQQEIFSDAKSNPIQYHHTS